LNQTQLFYLTLLLAFAFLANVPLGWLREGTRKLSPLWFLYIHLSIPFIIAARHWAGFGWGYVPLTLGMAVAGQYAGGRLRRKS